MKEKDMQRFCLLPIFCVAAFAFADVGDEEFIRQQQRQEQLHKQLQPQTDVRSEETSDQPVEPVLLITGEQPCFPVHEVDLDGEDAARFRFARTAH